MKKLFKTLILCLLVLTMSVSAFACGQDGEVETIEPVKKYHYEGTHIRTQEDTGKYLVKDGVTDYKLVVTNSTNFYLTSAKSDFIILFERATGIAIESVVDSDVADYTEDAKYISLGETKLVEQAGISKDEYSLDKLGGEGVRIITKGNSIFLLGASIFGVNYSIYTLFELMFNFEFYERDCMYIDTNVYNVPLMNYDVTELPDVRFADIAARDDWRGAASSDISAIDSLYYGANATEEVLYRGNRARNGNYGYYELSMLAYPYPEATTGYNLHNILDAYLNPKSPNPIDPKWIASSGTQACFTAHGDGASLEKFINHVAEIIKDSVMRYPTALYPEKNSITITCSDGSTTTCMCESCVKIAEANGGALIASHIMFLNAVNDIIQPWFEENKNEPWYRDNFQIVMFAYGATRQPPVYYDEETDTYEPTSEDVICKKGSAIFYVYGDGWYPTYHENTKEHREWLRGWRVLTPESELWHWLNAGNNVATTFYDALGTFNNDYYEFLACADIDQLYQSNFFSYCGSTSFIALSNYIAKKLRWNCHLDMNELADNFYQHMYGDGAEILKELYEKLKCYWYTLQADLESKKMLANQYLYTKENWPFHFNLMWYNEVERAVEAVSDPDFMESDPDGYTVLVHRIRMEAIGPLYNIISLHGKGNPRELNDEQLAKYKAALYDIAQHHPTMNAGAGQTGILTMALS